MNCVMTVTLVRVVTSPLHTSVTAEVHELWIKFQPPRCFCTFTQDTNMLIRCISTCLKGIPNLRERERECVCIPGGRLVARAGWCLLLQCPVLWRALCNWCTGPPLLVLMAPWVWCSYCWPLPELDPGGHVFRVICIYNRMHWNKTMNNIS